MLSFCKLFINICLVGFLMLNEYTSACSTADCQAVALAKFQNGKQHCDCTYKSGFTTQGALTEENDSYDHYWINYINQLGVQRNSFAPFAVGIVNRTTNQLLCLGFNMKGSNSSYWGGYDAESDIVAIKNCTDLCLPDVYISGRRSNNPGWADVILYSNVGSTPMGFHHVLTRGIKNYVYGARSSKLSQVKNWPQSGLTPQESADQSPFFELDRLRGPLIDLEDGIVNGFAYLPF